MQFPHCFESCWKDIDTLKSLSNTFGSNKSNVHIVSNHGSMLTRILKKIKKSLGVSYRIWINNVIVSIRDKMKWQWKNKWEWI